MKFPPGDPRDRNINLLGKKLLPAGDKIPSSMRSQGAKNRQKPEIPSQSEENPKSAKNQGRKIALTGTSQKGEYIDLACIKRIYRDIEGAIRGGQ